MDENVIKSEIEQGIAQVDSSLVITEFMCRYNKEARKLDVSFSAKSSNSDEIVEVSNSWD